MTVRILTGDARTVLRDLPDRSVQCCVTSPPYWNLRDYKVDGQIGLESDYRQYVAEMVAIFREVRRVLRDDGTLWLNLGDCYAQGGSGGQSRSSTLAGNGHGNGKPLSPYLQSLETTTKIERRPANGLKPGDIAGIPWRVAFALQDDGWYFRRDVVWHKPNPMPESVENRPTSSHEYVFLLTKTSSYYYDWFAIAEPVTGNAHARGSGINPKTSFSGFKTKQNSSFSSAVTDLVSRRNARSVWSIIPEPFAGAHFATMPPDLADRCIKAGTSELGCCPRCRAPWQRIVIKGEPDEAWKRACGADASGGYVGKSTKDHAAAGVQDASAVKARILAGMREKISAGWRMTCDCPLARPVSCTVLDPFGGAGTTGLVADRIRRDAILIELNPDYARMAADRLHGDAPLFVEMAT